MAGLFTHVWIAQMVLQELNKRNFISRYENIDDYFFGAIAPDIRYITGSFRDVTHHPLGHNSIFEALKVSSLSMPFMAGYETHLIVDATWTNDNDLLDESIYKHYNLSANDPIQKFSLYLLVDDYFQGEADWVFPISCAGNILRANDASILSKNLGISEIDILRYKSAAVVYMREPGIDTFNVFNVFSSNFDEYMLKNIADKIQDLTSFLVEFKKVSIDECIKTLERYT